MPSAARRNYLQVRACLRAYTMMQCNVHVYASLRLSGNSMGTVSSQHPRDILARMSLTCHEEIGRVRDDATRMSRVSGDFTVQIATRLPDWSASSLLPCSAAGLSFSKFHEHDTHNSLASS